MVCDVGAGGEGREKQGGGETEDQGRKGGTGGRERRLVCSHGTSDVLPGTVQACMHNTNTNTNTRSQPVFGWLVYSCPFCPGTNKHHPRDGGRERREAGRERSVVGTEGRGKGEGEAEREQRRRAKGEEE